jgi:hypothetical protein
MLVARLDCVPLAGSVLKPSTPLRDIRAVLGMPRSVLGLDQPEALLRQKAEDVGVVLHRTTVGQGSDRCSVERPESTWGHGRPSAREQAPNSQSLTSGSCRQPIGGGQAAPGGKTNS